MVSWLQETDTFTTNIAMIDAVDRGLMRNLIEDGVGIRTASPFHMVHHFFTPRATPVTMKGDRAVRAVRLMDDSRHFAPPLSF